MTGRISALYALRSIFRHPRRSALSIVGVGVGCAMAVFSTSWAQGIFEMEVRAACESGAGHLRIVPQGWVRTRDDTLRLKDWHAALEAARDLGGVRSVAVRARVTGLLAFGNRTSGVVLQGVDPAAETQANRIVRRARLEGRYLAEGDEGKTVIGRALAKRLDVEVGDDLYATFAGRDEIYSMMLTVVGTLNVGSEDLESMLCQVNWQDIERGTGYEGPGEISILLDDPRLIDTKLAKLKRLVPRGDEVVTWKEVSPEMAAGIEGDRAFSRILIGMVILVVMLGIASAQMTAILERHREFGVLAALGMKGRQVVALVVIEAVVIAVGGALVAILVGGAAAYVLATKGISLTVFIGEGTAFGDILLDPHFYGEFGWWIIWQAFTLGIVATVLSSLYPAWMALRVDPVEALRT
jgi:ABC-type lipoprotein release transport system permease subunit